MKTQVLTNRCLVKTVLLALFLFILNTSAFAQTKTYASSQTNQVHGICIGCSVQNPQNAIGNNESDYSTLSTPLGAISRVEQTLAFPATITQTSKVVIGIGTGTNQVLTAQLLSGVSIETFNGNISNDDYRFVNSELLKISSNSSNGTIEFITFKPYDRIEINYHSGVLNLNGGLRIYYAYWIDRIYATHAWNDYGVTDSDNAADNDENTYSILKAANGTNNAKQTLTFSQPPINKLPKKLVIGIGKLYNSNGYPHNNYSPISFASLGKLVVEMAYNGFGNYTRKAIVVDDSMFRSSLSDPTRATIEIDIDPTEFSTATLIWSHSQQLFNDGLRIYYAYYLYTDIPATMCPPALSPIHYYSLNENILDMPGGNLNLTRISANTEIFQNSLVCQQGLGYSTTEPETKYTFKGADYLNVPSPRAPRTVSFWARVDQGGSINLTLYGEKIKITQDSVIIKPIKEHPGFVKLVSRMFRRNPATPGALNLYVINFNNDPTPDYYTINTFYTSNANTNPPYYPVDLRMTVNGEGLPGPFPFFTPSDPNNRGNYPGLIETTYWAPYYTKGADLYNNDFIISFNKAQIDEFLIYDKKVSPKLLFNSYSQMMPNSNSVARISPSGENEIFAISPNPTTGQITLDGNILLQDANITIRNTFGREVYQAKVQSKTIDLPSTLSGGVYILTLQTKDKKVYSRKIILTR
ncbi:T9SS type A sorting domain-containing protein [Chryseobacterium sp. WG23]|uniref:T9SS type A sorting domain-containing protein n=1 Tax=Chryseobacterium sp. WG23 TaxID=2926910 RepID=UPI00211E6370|nr:T9SS type A sorting domain-containing protein [Chryseobacterium sp. WG23]MCQ9636476.1 T9SS type A sorting domain-containing protein [Chryseobacterium sp. WG23]